jgi:hypothetical protein
VYLRNVARNLWKFCSDPLTCWPVTFADQNYLPASRARVLVSAYSLGLLLVALPGLVRGLGRRDASAWTVLLVFGTLATAHSITFLNQGYTDVKLPLLAMGSTFALAALEGRSIELGATRVRLRLAALLAVTMLLCSVSATLLMLAR